MKTEKATSKVPETDFYCPMQLTEKRLLTRRGLLRIGFATMAGTLTAFTVACRNKRESKAYRIAAPIQGLTAEFMQLWVRGAQAHPAVKNGLATLTVFDGRMDALTQANQFDAVITSRYDAIIFVPVDAEAGLGPVQQAKEAGIPVIGSNTFLKDRSLYTSYIGSDSVESGRNVARAVIEKLGGKGKVVILEGRIGHSAQIQRRQGISEVLAQSPNVKVLETNSANWSRAEALALMENWLTAHGREIQGIIAQNDEMALGAIEAIKARGIDPATLPVGGVDGIADALRAVQHGEMSTTLQDSNAQAQGAIDLTLRKLIGASYQPMSAVWKQYAGQLAWGDGTQTEYLVPWTSVTKENADRLLALRQLG
jgi:putative xylitol transport system substrate-binding protein